MGSKMAPGGGGAMPSPNSHFSPPSVEELRDRLLRALDMKESELETRNLAVTNVQRIGEDVVISAYAGGKFSTHVDKLNRFPSDTLVDKLRLLF